MEVITVVIQTLLYGLQIGSVLALLAIGYTMVYGMVRLINFAHGDFLMIGAFIAYFAVFGLKKAGIVNTNLLIVIGVILLAMLLTGGIGVAVEQIAYKPLRNKARMSALITAIGVSLFLENAPRALPFIGPDPRPFPMLIPATSIQLTEGIRITSLQVIMIVASILLMVALHLFTTRHKIGKQMRAVSMDKDASALMGINVNKIISITFFIGAALAATSGILYSCVYPMIDVYMGGWLGTRSFICAVFGGIGDIRGAMLGGLLMGIIEAAATYFNSYLGYGVSFLILILVLLIRPQGLIGKITAEKV